MGESKEERAPYVSLKNGYDVGFEQDLTGDLVPLDPHTVTPGTGVFLQNKTGSTITYTVNSDVEFELSDNTGIVLYVRNCKDISVSGSGTMQYIVNIFN